METQKRFKAQLGLPYELLSDSDKRICTAFKTLNSSGTRSQRKTFIIDPEGKIAYIFDKVNISTHGEDVKNILNKLQND